MRPAYPVLIVSCQPDLVALATSWLAGSPSVVAATAVEAVETISSRALSGLIIFASAGSTFGSSRELIDQYVRAQPMGNIALLSGTEDMTIATALALPRARVDLFFRPWDGPAVRKFLGLATVPVAVGA